MRGGRTAWAVLSGLSAGLFLTSCDKKGEERYKDLRYQIGNLSVSRGSYSTNLRYLLIYRGSSPSGRVIVLFPGGAGSCHFGYMSEKSFCGKTSSNSIDISPDIWVSYNFVARTARDFALRGHTVILMDMPDDVKNQMSFDSRGPKIVASTYRVGGDWDGDSLNEPDDVTNDLNEVLNDIQTDHGISVTELYLVGTSRGTLATAYLSHKVAGVSGIVLTATVSSDNSGSVQYSAYCSSGATDFINCTGVNSFSGKILMVHHRDDGCSSSDYSSAQILYTSLPTGFKDFTTVTGGLNLSSNPCKAKTYHGFYGRDEDVVNLILDWIEGGTPPSDI